MSTTGHAVSWEGVRFAYDGAPVLRDVSLEVPAGACVALLGPNGAGKTTLTRMIMGLVRPQRGRVCVGDWDVAGHRPDEMARRVGYLFQHADDQLFARTVREDVGFGPRRLGRPAEADAVLAELGLAGVADRHPYDLPVPYRKLVALGGILAMDPGVLVLDEPTGGFDAELRTRVIRAVRTRVEQGVTVIAISHDLAFVEKVAGRRVELRDGVVRAG